MNNEIVKRIIEDNINNLNFYVGEDELVKERIKENKADLERIAKLLKFHLTDRQFKLLKSRYENEKKRTYKEIGLDLNLKSGWFSDEFSNIKRILELVLLEEADPNILKPLNINYFECFSILRYEYGINNFNDLKNFSEEEILNFEDKILNQRLSEKAKKNLIKIRNGTMYAELI